MIEARSVSKSYARALAVDDLSFTVASGLYPAASASPSHPSWADGASWPTGTNVTLALADLTDLAALLDWARAGGRPLTGLTVERPSLEDVHRGLTGGVR
jgi:hypothetical protein